MAGIDETFIRQFVEFLMNRIVKVARVALLKISSTTASNEERITGEDVGSIWTVVG